MESGKDVDHTFVVLNRNSRAPNQNVIRVWHGYYFPTAQLDVERDEGNSSDSSSDFIEHLPEYKTSAPPVKRVPSGALPAPRMGQVLAPRWPCS